MKYKIILQRTNEFENIKKPNSDKPAESSTLGNFDVYDEDGVRVWGCYAIENGGESTDTPNQDKRIVAREYTLHWTQSTKTPKGQKQCIWLHAPDLESFAKRRILIHAGNYPQDTEGCILLNNISSGKGWGGDSQKACAAFYDLVESKGIENFTLEVREIPAPREIEQDEQKEA